MAFRIYDMTFLTHVLHEEETYEGVLILPLHPFSDLSITVADFMLDFGNRMKHVEVNRELDGEVYDYRWTWTNPIREQIRIKTWDWEWYNYAIVLFASLHQKYKMRQFIPQLDDVFESVEDAQALDLANKNRKGNI